jgi:hypothetical protein
LIGYVGSNVLVFPEKGNEFFNGTDR